MFLFLLALLAVSLSNAEKNSKTQNNLKTPTIIVTRNISDIPYGVPVEWINFSSHLGNAKAWVRDHPYTLLYPIGYVEMIKTITVVVNSKYDTNSVLILNFPYLVEDHLNVTFAWYGPEWRLGVAPSP